MKLLSLAAKYFTCRIVFDNRLSYLCRRFSEGTTLFIMPDEAKYFGKENKATIYKMLSDGNSFNYYVKGKIHHQ